jgi:hypothetical protein
MSFAVASVTMMGAGVAMQTIGARASAIGQQNALNGNADLADINARLAELGAQSTMLAGTRQAGSILLKGGQVKSSQRANMAANGIDLGSDTATNVLTSTDVMKEVDADTAMANAVRQAWGYRTQATNFQNDALIKRSLASAINPNQIAMATFLDGAGKVASSWYSLNKVGAIQSGSGSARIIDNSSAWSPTK